MADALVSGASVRKDVEVRLLSAAPAIALSQRCHPRRLRLVSSGIYSRRSGTTVKRPARSGIKKPAARTNTVATAPDGDTPAPVATPIAPDSATAPNITVASAHLHHRAGAKFGFSTCQQPGGCNHTGRPTMKAIAESPSGHRTKTSRSVSTLPMGRSPNMPPANGIRTPYINQTAAITRGTMPSRELSRPR